MSPTTRAAVRQATLDSMAEANSFQAPILRKSTRARVEEAEKERQLAEQVPFRSWQFAFVVVSFFFFMSSLSSLGAFAIHREVFSTLAV